MKSSQTSSIRNRPWRLFAVLGAVTLLAAVLSMALGPVSVAPWDVLAALFSGSDGSAEARIVLYARLPRTAGCILAGAALAVSGALTQSVLANPLASPGTIGVNSGAGVAAAICCAVAPTSQALVPIAAFIGAMAATLLVLFIAERTGAAKITLVLAGVAISNVLSAGVDAVVTFAPDALNAYSDFRIGSLENLTLSRLAAPAIVTGAALIAAFSLTNELDVLMLGSETAESLGMRVGKTRIILLPHIIRRFTGDEARYLLPASALGGAALLLVCDLASRLLFAPYELPVGITLAFIGGPFFIWLLLRQRKGRIT